MRLLLLLLLLSPSFVWAQELRIGGKSLAAVGEELRLPVEGLQSPDIAGGLKPVIDWANKLQVRVDAPEGAEAYIEPDIALGLGQNAVRIRLLFSADKGGTYVIVFLDGNSVKLTTKRITVGPVVPPPDPPPGPGPGPSPAPIPFSGLRVLILEETSQRQTLPTSQVAILTSVEIREWLNTHCAKGAAGSPEYRVFDVDADVSLQAQHWKDALKRPRTGLPWILISDGKSGYEGPLPKTIAETLDLLKKYGG